MQVGGALSGRPVLLDGLGRSVLGLLVDRRDDLEPAAVDLGVGEVELAAQLGAHLLGDEPDVVVTGLVALGRLDLREGGLLALGGGQPALRDHPVEDVVPPLLRPLLLLLAQSRVVEGGCVDDAGEEGPLGGGQLRHVLVEVGLGRGLDAVGAPTEVDRVEVVLEDLVLAQLAVDLQRDEDLLGLAHVRLVLGEEVVLHVLLGDRRATTAVLAGDDAGHRAQDALGRDAPVVVEAAVLRGDEGVLHLRRHLAQVDRLAVDAGDPVHLGLAIGVVDDGGLRDGAVVGPGDVDRRVGDRDPGNPEDAQRHHGEQCPAQDPSDDATPAAPAPARPPGGVSASPPGFGARAGLLGHGDTSGGEGGSRASTSMNARRDPRVPVARRIYSIHRVECSRASSRVARVRRARPAPREPDARL